MLRIDIRQAPDWQRFDRLIIIISIVLIIMLLLLWVSDKTHLPFNCCHEHAKETMQKQEIPIENEPMAPLVEAVQLPAVAASPVPSISPELSLSLADGRLVVSGVVDSAATKLDQIRRQVPDAVVIDQLKVNSDVINLNQQLSLAHAQTSLNYLASKGLYAQRFTSLGMGETHLLQILLRKQVKQRIDALSFVLNNNQTFNVKKEA